MEKLEKKIENMLREDSAILALSKVTIPRIAKQIAQEVESDQKGIAIAFAKWKASNQRYRSETNNYTTTWTCKTDDELFTDFISQYNK